MFYHWKHEDLVLNVRVQTRASHNAFAETVEGPLGEQIKIRITAAPIEGKANKHLVDFLSKSFGVARSNISIISGTTSRDKRLCIHQPRRLPDAVVGQAPD